jgi:hypothetical protein
MISGPKENLTLLKVPMFPTQITLTSTIIPKE